MMTFESRTTKTALGRVQESGPESGPQQENAPISAPLTGLALAICLAVSLVFVEVRAESYGEASGLFGMIRLFLPIALVPLLGAVAWMLWRSRQKRRAAHGTVVPDAAAFCERAQDKPVTVQVAALSRAIHDPLAGMVSDIRSLKDSKLDALQQQQLDHLFEGSLLALHRLQDLCLLCEIERHQTAKQEADFAILPLVDQLSALLADDLSTKVMTFETDVADDIPLFLTGDLPLLRLTVTALLRCLIQNASEGARLSLSLALAAKDAQMTANDVHFRLFLSPPMPANIWERLRKGLLGEADPYPAIENAAAIGLALCQRLIGTMGGQLRLQTGESDGDGAEASGFTFTLPLPQGERPASWAMRGKGQARSVPHLTILVAEDMARNRQAACKMLRAMEHQVIEAEDGSQAIALTEQHRPDLILMDLSLPVMDGLSATKKLRAHGDRQLAKIPIIAMSPHVSGCDNHRFAEAGITTGLSKPFDAETLRDALYEAMVAEAFEASDMPAPDHEAGHADNAPLFDPAILEEDRMQLGEDAVDELIVAFLRDGPLMSGAIFDAPDASSQSQRAERLKGAAQNVGLIQLRDKALAIEKGGSPLGLERMMREGVKALATYRATLRPYS